MRWNSEGFDIDLNRGRIAPTGAASGGDRETELRPQLLTILRLLVENAGQVVGREAIQSEVWGDTVVDADNGLNFCIRQLRQILEDDAKNPRFIETVPRRGYVWIAPLGEVLDPDSVSATASATASDPISAGRPPARLAVRWALGAAAVLMLGLASWAVSGWTEPRPQETVSADETAIDGRLDLEVRSAFLEAHRLRREGSQDRPEYMEERLEFVLSHRPGWTPAMADLAVIRMHQARARPEEMTDIEAALRQGLDDEDPRVALEARLRLAQVEMMSRWNWRAARRHFEEALAVDPGHSASYRRMAFLDLAQGRHESAVRLADRALELEPVESLTLGNQFLVVHFARNYERALELAERTLRIKPGHYSALFVKLCAAEKLGLWQTAASAAPGILAKEELDTSLPDDPREAVRVFHRRRLDDRMSSEPQGSWDVIDLALGHAHHGDADAAFAALDRALERRSMHLPLHLSNSRFDPIRSDPRWTEMVLRMSLEARLPTDAALVAAAQAHPAQNDPAQNNPDRRSSVQ